MRRYITTAIDYPNAAPHMGHVLEKVLADVCARSFRLQGDEVRFQIGSDEHGIKIQQTAEKEKMTPKALVDRNVPLFQELYTKLGISADVFIRTSDQKKHWPTVQALWKKLQEAGMLEKRTYVGLYCSGCERFMTKRDLVEGKCPIHQRAPEEVKEENWFFLMSQDTENLKKLLTASWDGEQYRIVPESRAHETLSLIEQGLEDVSFSRPVSSLSWGIPVPGDEGQVMYVWCDALTNYISGLDYFNRSDGASHAKPSPSSSSAPLRQGSAGHTSLGEVWWDDAEITHVIGKDIARFHALIWPSMLKHAGVKVPNRLLIHGFLTSEGEKMSKSLGNVVAPEEAMTKYGVDALRFYLSHEIPVGNDGDFSWKRFAEVYDSKLRNQLGNLLNRVLVLLAKKHNGALEERSPPTDTEVWKTTEQTSEGMLSGDKWKRYAALLESGAVQAALQEAMKTVMYANFFMDASKPWAKESTNSHAHLTYLAELLRHTTLMLLPFVPETAQKMAEQLNLPCAKDMLDRNFVITKELKEWGGDKNWKTVGTPAILFPPIE